MEDDSTRTYIAISAGTPVSHYKIINRIGAGGMGEVYLAEDTKLHRNVALKFLSANFSADKALRGRFIREAEATAKLNHPRIVTIHEVDTYKGRPFFAMEHIQGQTLRDYYKSGQIPIERVIELSIQILNGLQAAHEKGVIHRDIKPSNILIDSEGRPKIVDFGLAALMGGEQLTRPHSTMGTIQYMSPEQIKGQKIGPVSDLFSFGIVLYQLLSGRLPFTGDNEAAVIHSITTETPASLCSQRAETPRELEQIVFKLLDKDPELRYQTASGVIADLKRLTHPSETISVSGKITTRARRNYLSLSLISLIVVVAILVFGPRLFDSGPAQEAQAGIERLAIMYFDNLPDPSDAGRLSEIITNLLETDLSESKYTRVMSSQRLYDIQKQLGREGQRKISRDDATTIAQKAHCQKMLLGTILQTEPNLVVTAHLVDVKSGTTLASQRVEGEPGESIFAFVDLLSSEIKKDLSLPAGQSDLPDRSIAEVTTTSPEAYRFYLEGREFENKHLESKAAEQYRMAVNLDSSFAMALCRLGWVSGGEERRRNLEAAMKLRDKVTQKERLHITSRYHISRFEFAAAAATLKKTVDRYPDEKEAWYDLGAICADQMGQVDTGIARLEYVIELDPFWEEAYNRLAYYYDRVGMYDKSIWAINQNVRLAPNDPNPYDTKGELLAVQGRLDDAKQAFQTALRLYPDFPHSIDRMGEILALERNYDSALIYFEKQIASDINRRRALGRTNNCTILALQGRLRQTAEQFREAENKDIQDGLDGLQPRISRAFILSELTTDTLSISAHWDSVFARVEQLEQVYPGWIPAIEYMWAILNLVDAGAYAKAEQILKTWQVRPGFVPDKLYSLARAAVAFANGDYKTASGLIDSSLSLTSMRKGWMYFLCGYWQGRTRYAAGQYDQAITILSELATMHSTGRFGFPLESVKLHYYLGRAYESSGQAKPAIARYEEFLRYWAEADPEIKLVGDAKARLAKLRKTI